MTGAPNKPTVESSPTPPGPEPQPQKLVETDCPEFVEKDIQRAKKPVGVPPVPLERLNELIDKSVPDLNKLLMWADDLEDERNTQAKSDEMLM